MRAPAILALAPLVCAGCWKGPNIAVRYDRLQAEPFHETEPRGTELFLDGDGMVRATDRVDEVDYERVTEEEVRVRDHKPWWGPQEKRFGTRERVAELKRTPVRTGSEPWTGSLAVEVSESAWDWQASGTVRVTEGALENHQDLPVVPLFLDGAAVTVTSTPEALAAGVYADLAAMGLSKGVFEPDTPFVTTRDYWYQPVGMRVRLVAMDLPKVAADPFPKSSPEPYVAVFSGEQGYGCTDSLGDDLGAGQYPFAGESELVGGFRRVDPLVLVVKDVDLNQDDVLETFTQFPGPVSGTAGWITLEAEPFEGERDRLAPCERYEPFKLLARALKRYPQCIEENLGNNTLQVFLHTTAPETAVLDPVTQWLDGYSLLYAGTVLTGEDPEVVAAMRMVRELQPQGFLMSWMMCTIPAAQALDARYP